MNRSVDWILFAGALTAGIAVAAGAFGAHGLVDRVTPERLQTFETAVRYQMYHGLALFGLAMLYRHKPISSIKTSAWLFVVGILIFSGSLYLLVLTDTPWLGAITPIGGVAFILGWIWLIRVAWSDGS